MQVHPRRCHIAFLHPAVMACMRVLGAQSFTSPVVCRMNAPSRIVSLHRLSVFVISIPILEATYSARQYIDI